MRITVTPTTSAVGINAGLGPGASNTNSWVPMAPLKAHPALKSKVIFNENLLVSNFSTQVTHFGDD